MNQHHKDRALLADIEDREAQIADAATRIAYERAGDWLSQKQAKAEQFPGGDLEHAKGRAAAYQNAAQELYGWAIAHGGEAAEPTSEPAQDTCAWSPDCPCVLCRAAVADMHARGQRNMLA